MTDHTPQTTTRDEAVRDVLAQTERRENGLRANMDEVATLAHQMLAIIRRGALRPDPKTGWLEPASAPAPASGRVDAAQSLHHASGERITRKDLNDAYRKGAEDGRLATRLIDSMFDGPVANEASLSPAATPVSEAGGDWRSVLAGMVDAMNRYGHEVGDGDIPSAHRNLISQAEQLLAETTSSVAEDVRALAIVRMFKERIERHGNWDEGCFYYGSTSASELQEPLRLATAALAKPVSSPAGGDTDFLRQRRGELVIERDAARAAVESLIAAIGNDGKVTSLHEWNERMQRAVVDAKIAIARDVRKERAALSQSTSAGRGE